MQNRLGKNKHVTEDYEYTVLSSLSYLEQPLGSDGQLLDAGGAGGLAGEHLVTGPTYPGLAPLLPRHRVPQIRALAAEDLRQSRGLCSAGSWQLEPITAANEGEWSHKTLVDHYSNVFVKIF